MFTGDASMKGLGHPAPASASPMPQRRRVDDDITMAISDSLQSVHKQITDQLAVSFQLCEKNLSAALDIRLREVTSKLEQNESKQKERD
eukprot:16164454-Heterocapsa_arctica.AAC.1